MNKGNQPVCAVVGTSNRTGWNIARTYATRGFKIAFIGWSRRDLDMYQDKAQNFGFRSDAFFMEDNKNGTLEKSLRKVRKELGHIDVMIYNESVWSPNFREFTQENSVWGDLRMNESWALTAVNEVYNYMKDYRRGRIYFTSPEFNPRFRSNDRRFQSTQDNFRRMAYDFQRNGVWVKFYSNSNQNWNTGWYSSWNNQRDWQNNGYSWNSRRNWDNYSYNGGSSPRYYGNGDYHTNQWNGHFNNRNYDYDYNYNYGSSYNRPYQNRGEFFGGYMNDFANTNDRFYGDRSYNDYTNSSYNSQWGPSNFNGSNQGFDQNWSGDYGYSNGFDNSFDFQDQYQGDDFGNEFFDASYNQEQRTPQSV